MTGYQNLNFNPYMASGYSPYNYAGVPQTYNPGISFSGVIAGRSVNDFSEITINDIPTNGQIAVFPKNDMSEVQIRAWGADGKVRTTSYKPVSGDLDRNLTADTPDGEKLKFDEIRAEMNNLDTKLDSLAVMIDGLKDKETGK